VLLVASSIQVRHLFEVSEKMAKDGALQAALSRVVITSIGPLTSEELRNRGLPVDIECSHPKMGYLVREAAEKAPELLKQKR
jgi:uroporphyrinogen-III synthase